MFIQDIPFQHVEMKGNWSLALFIKMSSQLCCSQMEEAAIENWPTVKVSQVINNLYIYFAGFNINLLQPKCRLMAVTMPVHRRKLS